MKSFWITRPLSRSDPVTREGARGAPTPAPSRRLFRLRPQEPQVLVSNWSCSPLPRLSTLIGLDVVGPYRLTVLGLGHGVVAPRPRTRSGAEVHTRDATVGVAAGTWQCPARSLLCGQSFMSALFYF